MKKLIFIVFLCCFFAGQAFGYNVNKNINKKHSSATFHTLSTWMSLSLKTIRNLVLSEETADKAANKTAKPSEGIELKRAEEEVGEDEVGETVDEGETSESRDDVVEETIEEEVAEGPAYHIPSPVVRQPAASLWEPSDISIESDYLCFEESMIDQGEEVGPYSFPISASGFTGIVYYVDGVSDGDGSVISPFSTISEAVEAASGTGGAASILVAGGLYEEDLTLTGDHHLFGGFDPSTWIRDISANESIIRVQTDSLYVYPVDSPSFEQVTIIDGFTIYGPQGSPGEGDYPSTAIVLKRSSRTIIRNNTIYAGMIELDCDYCGDDTHRGSIMYSFGMNQIHNNRFLIPSDDLEHVSATGLSLGGSRCQTIFKNHFVSFTTSIFTSPPSRDGQITVVGNLIEDGRNGISNNGGPTLYKDNTIAIQNPHARGCLYAFNLSDTWSSLGWWANGKPSLIDNTIILQRTVGSVKGINEMNEWANPLALLGNNFVLIDMESTALYLDRQSPMWTLSYNSIEDVNSMTDISDVGENTVEVFSSEDLGL